MKQKKPPVLIIFLGIYFWAPIILGLNATLSCALIRQVGQSKIEGGGGGVGGG